MPSQPQEKRRLGSQDAPAKRLRVSRACDQCRTAREKCDGNQPVCGPCNESRRECTFTSNPRKRGLQPGYIRSLETTLALIFQHNPDVEAFVSTQLAQENTVLLARGTKESNALHKRWRKSKFCKDISKVLAGEPLGTKDDDKLPTSDEDSEVDVESTTLLQDGSQNRGVVSPAERMILGTPTFPKSSRTQPASIMQHQMGTPASDTSLMIAPQPPSHNLVALPPDFWALLEAYSTFTQCWLPMCEKLQVLKMTYSYPEHGLILSQDMPDSGHHAEMWSIFAVGSLQLPSTSTGEAGGKRRFPQRKLYETSKLLIPDELGSLDLNHIKALLNLAVFNISKSLSSAAWMLLGHAARGLTLLDSKVSGDRYRNVVSSCFLLDSFLALQLQKRPYFDQNDLSSVGRIEEDGMEEWQPWGGELGLRSADQPRLPTLALSTFNGLLDLVDVLLKTAQQPTARNFLHQMIGRLEAWKSSLPTKLEYIRSESLLSPMNPPAVLLQLTYLTTALILVPSQAWLQRILETLYRIRDQLTFSKLPPIVICLLQGITRAVSTLALNQETQDRMRDLFMEIIQTYSSLEIAQHGTGVVPMFASTSPTLLHPQSTTFHTSPQASHLRSSRDMSNQYGPPRGSSSLLDDLLPDMNPNRSGSTIQQLDSIPLRSTEQVSPAGHMDLASNGAYNAFMPEDLESFFDELSTLHGAKKQQNQPQFMENLGFSTEVSMDDLLAADASQFLATAPGPGTEDLIPSRTFSLDHPDFSDEQLRYGMP